MVEYLVNVGVWWWILESLLVCTGIWWRLLVFNDKCWNMIRNVAVWWCLWSSGDAVNGDYFTEYSIYGSWTMFFDGILFKKCNVYCLPLRKLVSAVKQGGSYFQLLQEQEEQKNEKRRKKEERRRTHLHHPSSISDSEIENEEER